MIQILDTIQLIVIRQGATNVDPALKVMYLLLHILHPSQPAMYVTTFPQYQIAWTIVLRRAQAEVDLKK